MSLSIDIDNMLPVMHLSTGKTLFSYPAKVNNISLFSLIHFNPVEGCRELVPIFTAVIGAKAKYNLQCFFITKSAIVHF